MCKKCWKKIWLLIFVQITLLLQDLIDKPTEVINNKVVLTKIEKLFDKLSDRNIPQEKFIAPVHRKFSDCLKQI